MRRKSPAGETTRRGEAAEPEERPPASVRRPYRKPQLEDYGSIHDLTRVGPPQDISDGLGGSTFN